MDKRDLYAPLRRPEDFQLTWPLLPGEVPPQIKPECNRNCRQGRACDCVPNVSDTEHAQMEGAGAVVVPAVIAAVLAVAAFVVLIAGWIS